jgi:hypothetical protein
MIPVKERAVVTVPSEIFILYTKLGVDVDIGRRSRGCGDGTVEEAAANTADHAEGGARYRDGKVDLDEGVVDGIVEVELVAADAKGAAEGVDVRDCDLDLAAAVGLEGHETLYISGDVERSSEPKVERSRNHDGGSIDRSDDLGLHGAVEGHAPYGLGGGIANQDQVGGGKRSKTPGGKKEDYSGVLHCGR